MAIPWRLTHLLLNRTFCKTRALILNSVKFFPHISFYVLIPLFFFFHHLTKYYIYTKNKSIKTKHFKQKGKRETAIKKLKQTVSMENPFEILGRHAKFHEKPVLPKRTQNLILYQGSPLGTSWRLGNLKFLRQLHGAPRDFSFPLAGGRSIFARPGGPRAGEATGTYPRRPVSTTTQIRTPNLDAVWLR